MRSFLKKSVLLFSVLLLIGCTATEENTHSGKSITEGVQQKTVKDEGITTIKKFYQHITDGELKEAHDMYEIKKVGFQTFTEWYENTEAVNPVKINPIEEGKYSIIVHFQEKGGEVQSFDVIMKVLGNKINSISSKEIINKYEAQFDEKLSAKIVQKEGINSVILLKEGKEIILAENNALWFNEDGSLKDSTKIYSEPQFSSTGRYLSYETEMWEWGTLSIYDTEKEKELKILDGVNQFFYTENDSQFIACSSNFLMGTHYAFIYDLPNLEVSHTIYNRSPYYGDLKTWVNPEKFLTYVNCEFDEKEQKAIVNLEHDNYYNYKDVTEYFDTIEYDFKTGVETKL